MVYFQNVKLNAPTANPTLIFSCLPFGAVILFILLHFLRSVPLSFHLSDFHCTHTHIHNLIFLSLYKNGWHMNACKAYNIIETHR